MNDFEAIQILVRRCFSTHEHFTKLLGAPYIFFPEWMNEKSNIMDFDYDNFQLKGGSIIIGDKISATGFCDTKENQKGLSDPRFWIELKIFETGPIMSAGLMRNIIPHEEGFFSGIGEVYHVAKFNMELELVKQIDDLPDQIIQHLGLNAFASLKQVMEYQRHMKVESNG